MTMQSDLLNCLKSILLSKEPVENCCNKNINEFLKEKGEDQNVYNELVSVYVKQLLFEIIQENKESDAKFYVIIERLLDITLWMNENNFGDGSLSFFMIEDLLDVVTIDASERVFDLIDSRVDRLVVGLEPNKGKGLIILRFCNELLRKLSRIKNTVFCGRILMILANIFPLNERSGVNLKGEFNIENVTIFEDFSNEMKDEDDELKDFYMDFWSLQKFFVNPISIFQPENFKKFQKKVDKLYAEFEKISKIESSRKKEQKDHYSPSKSRRSAKVADNAPDQKAAALDLKRKHFFPKYLTGWNLFSLELNDPFFKRQVLVQTLIILQFLSTLSQKEKEKTSKYFSENLQIVANRSVLYTYVLSSDQEKWVAETRSNLMVILEGISPFGKMFSKTLTTIISHEKNWLLWKMGSCQAYEKDPVPIIGKKRKLASSLAVRLPNQLPWLGCQELTELWKRGTEMDKILKRKAEKIKTTVKPLKEFLEELSDQYELDGSVAYGVEEEYLHNKNNTFNWGAYRTALRHNVHLFSKISGGINTVELLQQWRKDNGLLIEIPAKKEAAIEVVTPINVDDEGKEKNWNLNAPEFIPSSQTVVEPQEPVEKEDVEMKDAN